MVATTHDEYRNQRPQNVATTNDAKCDFQADRSFGMLHLG
jgi:hypothetical protein